MGLKETEGQIDRQTERQIDRPMDGLMDVQTDRPERHSWTGRWLDIIVDSRSEYYIQCI